MTMPDLEAREHTAASTPDVQAAQRMQMVQVQLAERGIQDLRVLQVMGEIPREEFLPPQQAAFAYEDRALSVGFGQTISQPYVVGLMTASLALKATDVVLEVGTGTGYQTAILARLARHVFTIERVSELSALAQARFARFDLNNISSRLGDGSRGWPEFSPYDAIIVTAAAPTIIRPLVDQLGDGGRMIVPVGDDHSQTLTMIERRGRAVIEKPGIAVRFVKLLGEHGFRD